MGRHDNLDLCPGLVFIRSTLHVDIKVTNRKKGANKIWSKKIRFYIHNPDVIKKLIDI